MRGVVVDAFDFRAVRPRGFEGGAEGLAGRDEFRLEVVIPIDLNEAVLPQPPVLGAEVTKGQ
jgi:hypothetical protein